eukprot:ANDGO_02054.mRNA.1 hypothetical protein
MISGCATQASYKRSYSLTEPNGASSLADSIVSRPSKRTRREPAIDPTPLLLELDDVDEALASTSEVSLVADHILSTFPASKFPAVIPFFPVHFIYNHFADRSAADAELHQLSQLQYVITRLPCLPCEDVVFPLECWKQQLAANQHVPAMLKEDVMASIRSGQVERLHLADVAKRRILLSQGFYSVPAEKELGVADEFLRISIPNAVSVATDLRRARRALLGIFKGRAVPEVPVSHIVERIYSKLPPIWAVWDAIGKKVCEVIHAPSGKLLVCDNP